MSRASASNPYEPPGTRSESSIGNDLVVRLIEKDRTVLLAFSDVSDTQLYGARKYRLLSGELAASAELSGCFPEVYQTIHWLCLVHMPVWPLGTYVVMPCKECDDPESDADQFRAIRVDTEWPQVALHYAVFFTMIAVVAFGIYAWWLNAA